MDLTLALALIVGAFLIGWVLGQSSGEKSPLPPPDPAALNAVRPIFAAEGKILAIKEYRRLTGVGLKEAKFAVDTLDRPT